MHCAIAGLYRSGDGSQNFMNESVEGFIGLLFQTFHTFSCFRVCAYVETEINFAFVFPRNLAKINLSFNLVMNYNATFYFFIFEF